MKKLNNALNEINDKYIEEAAQSERLQRNTAKTVRNIAVPVVSAAAVVGLCFGMTKLGVFGGKEGVDLLPASSDTSGAAASTASSTTVTVPYQPNDYQYEQDIFFPDDIPLVNKTQSDIESIIFGSEFPEMLYADEKISMFTDGVGGLYIYDMTQEELTFATDVYDSFLLAIEQFPEDFGGDSWNGISLYALEDGTPLCSLTYPSKNTTKGAGESITEHYLIHTKTPGLERIDNAELKDYPVYHGLSELPYDEKYHAISLSAAHYGDNGEFVYIRNAPADIDLSPKYDMQTIELRRWTEGEVTSDAADGGYYPFTHEVGKYVEWHDHYISTVQSLSDGTEYNTVALVLNDDKTFKFSYNTASSTGNTAEGTYEIAGDLISLDFNDGGNLVYRNDGATLFPCTAGTAGLSDDIIAVSTALLYSEIKYDVLQHEREKYDELQQMFEEQLDARTIELEKYEQLQQSLEEHRQALERLENEQDALVLQEEIQKLTEKREELLEEIELLQQELEQLEQHDNEEDKLAMYLSMLRRGSSFDGNYFAPDFVNILDG
ncbi:MAG: hypothetical protein E7478_05805, partial [Ruminococcaceae bacterium]|nr:hypothetical protein [Oscillospiraceae bacterium]